MASRHIWMFVAMGTGYTYDVELLNVHRLCSVLTVEIYMGDIEEVNRRFYFSGDYREHL